MRGGESWEDLFQIGPLPMSFVNWESGWKHSDYLSNKSALQKARNSVCRIIYNRRDELSNPSMSFDEDMAEVDAYLRLLLPVCLGEESMGNRTIPLDFEWCFPAETNEIDIYRVTTMQCCMAAYEFLCVSSFLALQYATSGMPDICFERCIVLCNETVRLVYECLFNKGQWRHLCRQGLPIQITPQWFALLGAKAAHKAQLHCIELISAKPQTQERDDLLVAVVRGGEKRCLVVLCAMRQLIVECKFLTDHQLKPILACYEEVVIESHRLRVQCMIYDAELALYNGYSFYTEHILSSCLSSANLPGCLTLEQISTVHSRVDSLRSLARKTSTMETRSHEEMSEWRRNLKCTDYKSLGLF